MLDETEDEGFAIHVCQRTQKTLNFWSMMFDADWITETSNVWKKTCVWIRIHSEITPCCWNIIENMKETILLYFLSSHIILHHNKASLKSLILSSLTKFQNDILDFSIKRRKEFNDFCRRRKQRQLINMLMCLNL